MRFTAPLFMAWDKCGIMRERHSSIEVQGEVVSNMWRMKSPCDGWGCIEVHAGIDGGARGRLSKIHGAYPVRHRQPYMPTPTIMHGHAW